MTPRVKCRRCSAMILEITASVNGGFCGSCVKTRGMRYRTKQVGNILYFLGGLLVMPFLLLYFEVQRAWRCWRFPFDRPAMPRTDGVFDEDAECAIQPDHVI